MKETEITKYVNLIERFLTKEVDAVTFERCYLDMFKHQDCFLPTSVFQILDGLFGDVDAFCADPEIRGDADLNEEQLRDRCGRALKQLRSFAADSELS